MKKENLVLKEVLSYAKPTKDTLKDIDSKVKEFVKKLKRRIKTMKIDCEVFVGGSYAKKTLIKRDYYDVDIFLRFGKKCSEEALSDLSRKILEKDFDFEVVKGSRNYYKINISKNFDFEVVPVRKVSKPKDAKNITDLSYSHVKYINKKIKNNNILDEIILAKAFCYANGCYGAESYIDGFSGYSLELLVIYYKSFLKFLKEMVKVERVKIIDMEKMFKNKNEIMIEINSSKLNSPIILIDPTFSERNVAAALSRETFEKFRDSAKKFLKKPSKKSFEKKIIDFSKLAESSKKRNEDFLLFEIKTNKQRGDIAGSKLKKFFGHLVKEFEEYFNVKKEEFYYLGKDKAKCFLEAKKKPKLIHFGPYIDDKKNVERFKKNHPKTYVEKKRIYSEEKIDFSLKEFLNKWILKHKRIINEMKISEIKII